jgi:hypothetical protein
VTYYEQHLWRARIDTLRHALKVAGDETGLARLLAASPDRVSRWVSGEEAVPLDIFLNALDLVARGPYQENSNRRRRPVVAAIPPKDAGFGG